MNKQRRKKVEKGFDDVFDEPFGEKRQDNRTQEQNEVLSNLMDAGKLLFGKLNEKTWVDNWLKLDVQV